MKRVTPSTARHFIRDRCKEGMDEMVKPVEELCDGVETVKRVLPFGDKVNAGGRCEAAVTARARVGWMKFGECGELQEGEGSHCR